MKINRPITLSHEEMMQAFLPDFYIVKGQTSFAQKLRFDDERLMEQRRTLRNVLPSQIHDLSRAMKDLYSSDGVLLSDTSLGKTVANIFEQYCHRPCFGVRSVKDGVFADKYEFMSYKEVSLQSVAFGHGLVSSFVLRSDSTTAMATKVEHVALMSDVSREAVIAELGCVMQGLAPIFLPPGLSPEYANILLTQLQPIAIIVSEKYLDLMMQSLALSKLHCVSCICCLSSSSSQAKHTFRRYNFTTYEELCEVGTCKSIQNNSPYRVGKMSDLFTLMYTSGSTSIPKGTIRTCRSWIDYICYLTESSDKKSEKCVMCYAPLSHIMERSNIWTTLAIGGSMGLFERNPADLLDDICVLQPTTLSSVPSLWNSLYAIYQSKINAAKLRFQLNEKNKSFEESFEWHSIKVSIVVEMQQMLGGRIREVVTGGAPTSLEVLDFLKTCFNVNVFDGYGISEVGPVLTDGRPVPGVEIKLVDVPSMGYLYSDSPCPRGELWVKTPNMFGGYFGHSNAQNSEVESPLQAGGWYATGDIGVLGSDGKITIVDRKNNIFKLSHGEFISPEKLENIFLVAPWLEQIFIHGNTYCSYIVAVVVLKMECPSLASYLHHHGFTPNSLTCDKNARKLVEERMLKSFEDIGKKHSLAHYEIPRGVMLELSRKFTNQNKCLTDTRKLNRRELSHYYRDSLCVLMDKLENVEEQVKNLIQDILNLKSTEAISKLSVTSSNFTQLGGDSLTSLKLMSMIRENFGVDISLAMLHTHSIIDIAKHIENSIHEKANYKQYNQGDAIPQEDQSISNKGYFQRVCDDNGSSQAVLLRDLQLKKLITVNTPIQYFQSSSARFILVTGGTGFIGAHLLHQLVRDTKAIILCLVRSIDLPSRSVKNFPLIELQGASVNSLVKELKSYEIENDRNKLLSVLQAYDCALSDDNLNRVIVVSGDLSEFQFGLTDRAYVCLKSLVDCVMHGAAMVNWLADYKQSRLSNVIGTLNVIEFCSSR